MKANTALEKSNIRHPNHLLENTTFAKPLKRWALYLGLGLSITSAHAQGFNPRIPGEYIVVLKPFAKPSKVAADHKIVPKHAFAHALNGFAGSIPDGRLRALQNDPRVAYVEENLLMFAFGQTVPTGV